MLSVITQGFRTCGGGAGGGSGALRRQGAPRRPSGVFQPWIFLLILVFFLLAATQIDLTALLT